LLRMMYSVVPRPSAVPYPRPKKGFYSCTSYSEKHLPEKRRSAVRDRLLLRGNPDCLLANAPGETAPELLKSCRNPGSNQGPLDLQSNPLAFVRQDRKSTRLNSSHTLISS